MERLYQLYGAGLLAYGCAITVDRAAAEDVLHQVFLKLLRGDVELPEVARPYLYRAMRNAALNSRRVVSREIELDAENSWFVAPQGRTEEALTLQGGIAGTAGGTARGGGAAYLGADDVARGG